MLRDIAAKTGRTKSEVLRAGLRDQRTKLEFQAERRWAFSELARMAEEIPGGPKIRWRMKH